MDRRVLIVEDSSVMRELLTLAIKKFPRVHVDQAEDGVAALRIIRSVEQPYDLIFLDLNMPIMGGMKLLGYVRDEELANDTVIAVITTEESDQAEVKARALGALYFLRKPVTRRMIEEVLVEVFEAREHRLSAAGSTGSGVIIANKKLCVEILRLLVQVAWIDHEIADAERDHILSVASRADLDAPQLDELRAALNGDSRLPAPDLGFLRAHKRDALQAAAELVSVDRRVAAEESQALQQIRDLLNGL